MKKTLVFIFVLVLTFAFSAVTAAETIIDLSSYSLDELLKIKEDLANEISKRPGGEKLIYGAGNYRIGEDIPAGVYLFVFVNNGDDNVSRTDYYVYENENMYNYDVGRLWLGDMPREEGSLKGTGEKRISLYPGEYLVFRYNGAEGVRVGNVGERMRNYQPPSGTTIPIGEYTVGAEIPPGTYTVHYSGNTTSRVRVFQDSEEASNSFNEGKETILNELNPEGMVFLNEGNILRVEYTPIVMKKGEGFKFD